MVTVLDNDCVMLVEPGYSFRNVARAPLPSWEKQS